MRNDILVLGAGAWGTAIANLLAENCNKKIFLWAYEKKVSDSINNKQINTSFLPKINLFFLYGLPYSIKYSLVLME